jgi:replicative DNA helicase
LKNRFERAGKKLEFIVVDYLKFIRASDRYRGHRNLEVGEITGGLKSLAKDIGIAVILLCQLNRETEKTSDRRPELAHLRDSGEIEQDADVVLFLFREAYYLQNDPNGDPSRLAEVQNILEIICAKQRMGPTGTVQVFCHPGASAIRDLGRAA